MIPATEECSSKCNKVSQPELVKKVSQPGTNKKVSLPANGEKQSRTKTGEKISQPASSNNIRHGPQHTFSALEPRSQHPSMLAALRRTQRQGKGQIHFYKLLLI